MFEFVTVLLLTQTMFVVLVESFVMVFVEPGPVLLMFDCADALDAITNAKTGVANNVNSFPIPSPFHSKDIGITMVALR